MRIQPIGGTDAPTSPRQAAENADVAIPFALDGDVGRFAPDIFPNTLRVTKSRNLNRSDNFCGGEDVSDQGAENKEVHASGYVKQENTGDVWDIVNQADKLELTSPSWSGEVRIEEVELSGPSGYNPESEAFYWEYTLDLVSTGKDEPGGATAENGIISDGT